MENDALLYWDKAADSKKFCAPFKINVLRKLIKTSDLILDFGCGYGRTLHVLWQLGFKNIYGLDLSYRMLIKARKTLPAVSFLQCDGIYLPFASNTFNVILVIAVLGCIAESSIIQKTVNEISRLVKANGIIYVSEFLINESPTNIQRYKLFNPNPQLPYGTFIHGEGVILRHFSKDDLRHYFEKFSLLHYQEEVSVTMNGNPAKSGIFVFKK